MNPEEENIYIESYLLGNLSKEEVAIVEKRMSEDVRFRESVLLQKELYASLDESDWSFAKNVTPEKIQEYETLFKSKETAQLKEAILKAQSDYKKNTSKNGRSLFYYLSAAVVIVMITISVLLSKDQTSQDLYVTYYTTSDIPSLVSRGGEDDSELINAERYFENAEYTKALEILIPKVATVTKNKASVLLYKGISEMELGQFEKAHTSFDQLIHSDLLDAPMGLWYKALLYLKMDAPEKAKTILQQISSSSSNYKYTEAKELLEKL
ncbi:tol-pal system YbgF family protein [Dokdonia ponticola]|uniref:Tol-pal system YbgF family protein n=1 Tax=Dokdonia ponticola TaxID=2041041 RepID=A0ABV9HZ36_9FLAO